MRSRKRKGIRSMGISENQWLKAIHMYRLVHGNDPDSTAIAHAVFRSYTCFYWIKKLHLTKVAVLAFLVIFHRQELGIMLERLKNKWSSVERSADHLSILANKTFDFPSQSKICQHSSTLGQERNFCRGRGKSLQTFATNTPFWEKVDKC